MGAGRVKPVRASRRPVGIGHRRMLHASFDDHDEPLENPILVDADPRGPFTLSRGNFRLNVNIRKQTVALLAGA